MPILDIHTAYKWEVMYGTVTLQVMMVGERVKLRVITCTGWDSGWEPSSQYDATHRD